MMHKQITHKPGTFAACSDCRKEPRHFIAMGSTTREGVAFTTVPERHQLECRCGRRTGWRPSLAETTKAWGELGETLPLPLQAPAAKVTPMRRGNRSATA